jgi:hypothetical protein
MDRAARRLSGLPRVIMGCSPGLPPSAVECGIMLPRPAHVNPEYGSCVGRYVMWPLGTDTRNGLSFAITWWRRLATFPGSSDGPESQAPAGGSRRPEVVIALPRQLKTGLSVRGWIVRRKKEDDGARSGFVGLPPVLDYAAWRK